MEYHTILIGTSKTVATQKYFCERQNIKRFWGTLSETKNIFSGKQEDTKLLNECGVYITDISAAKPAEEKRDKEIKAISLQKGFKELEILLNSQKNLKRIGFVGKQAAQWFFIRFIDNIDIRNESLCFKVELFHYGSQSWKIKFNDLNITCFVLPNTGRQWKKDSIEWTEFWKYSFSKRMKR